MPFHHLGVILDQFSCFSPQLLFLWSWRHTPFWFYYMPFRYQKYAVDFYELISNKELFWILFSRFTCSNPRKTRSGCPKTCLEYYQSSQWGFGAIPRSWSPPGSLWVSKFSHLRPSANVLQILFFTSNCIICHPRNTSIHVRGIHRMCDRNVLVMDQLKNMLENLVIVCIFDFIYPLTHLVCLLFLFTLSLSWCLLWLLFAGLTPKRKPLTISCARVYSQIVYIQFSRISNKNELGLVYISSIHR